MCQFLREIKSMQSSTNVPWNFKENVHWPLSIMHTVEEPTYQQTIINRLRSVGNPAVVSCLPCSSPGCSHILQHDPDRERCRELQRGWAELLLLWCHKEEICSSAAASAWCSLTVLCKENFLLLPSKLLSLKLWILMDFVDTDMTNPSEVGYTPDLGEEKISACPRHQVLYGRWRHQSSAVTPCEQVEWWQRSGFPSKEVWAGSALRTFVPISHGG